MSKRKASDEMGRYVTASGSGSYNNGQYKASQSKKQTNSISYLLVDGYNIIHAWSELEELSRINMDSARDKLLDIMCCQLSGSCLWNYSSGSYIVKPGIYDISSVALSSFLVIGI